MLGYPQWGDPKLLKRKKSHFSEQATHQLFVDSPISSLGTSREQPRSDCLVAGCLGLGPQERTGLCRWTHGSGPTDQTHDDFML